MSPIDKFLREISQLCIKYHEMIVKGCKILVIPYNSGFRKKMEYKVVSADI